MGIGICNSIGGGGGAAKPNGSLVFGLRTMVVDTQSIKLDWINIGNCTVQVDRSTDGVNFTSIYITVAGAITYTDTGLTAATDYYYRIKAINSVAYKDYCAIQLDRTLPVSAKYPFVETTNWNNANHAIKDIRLYIPDASIKFYVYYAGWDTYTSKFVFLIMTEAGAAVALIDFSTGSYLTTSGLVKYHLVRPDNQDFNYCGWVIMDLSQITGGVQYGYAMVNKPFLASSCIIQGVDPRQTLGKTLIIDNSFVVSDPLSLYAHESSICVLDNVILVAYYKGLLSSGESTSTNHAVLVTVNKNDNSFTEQIIAKDGGIYGGKTFSAGVMVWIPRIYKLSDGTVRIYFHYNGICYYRDYDSDTNSLGNVIEFTAIIDGGTTPVLLSSANLKTHCVAMAGSDTGYFDNLKLFIRNANMLYDNGDGNRYMLGEMCTPSSYTWPVFMKSTDGGYTWQMQGIAYLPVVDSYPRYLENNLMYNAGTWYISSRVYDYRFAICTSTDGITWTAYTNSQDPTGVSIPQINIGLRNAFQKIKENIHLGAYSHRRLQFRTTGKERSCLGFAIIDNMENAQVRLLANNNDLIHYPSMDYWNDKYIYLSYTTAELSGGGQSTLKNTIRIVKIPLADL